MPQSPTLFGIVTPDAARQSQLCQCQHCQEYGSAKTANLAIASLL
jgi:hypothetical protein